MAAKKKRKKLTATAKLSMGQLRKRKLIQEFQIELDEPKLTYDEFEAKLVKFGEECATIGRSEGIYVINVYHESPSLRDSLLYVLGVLKKKGLQVRSVTAPEID